MSKPAPVKGYKLDSGKTRYGLMPPDVMELIAQVYTMGADKYDDNNWLLGMDWSKLYDASQRHMNAFWAGQENDPESGLPHPVHAAWNCIALATYLIRGLGTDNRAKCAMPAPLDIKAIRKRLAAIAEAKALEDQAA